jgi:excisionase family DNA binding protein
MVTMLVKPRTYWRQLAISQEPADSMPVLLTITEVCSMLRISRWKVYQLIRVNKLGTVKFGSRRLVPIESVRALIRDSEAV